MPGRADPIALKPDHVHDAGVIDPKTRALPLQIEVENRDRASCWWVRPARPFSTRARTQRVPVVPQDGGPDRSRPAVRVRASRGRDASRGGSSRSRRAMASMVGVRSGVKPGDRVVTRGAYEIQLASAAKGLPAEGHVH